MQSTLIDTSSLIQLSLRNRWGEPPKISAILANKDAFFECCNRVTAGVEAIVLFEDILVDQPSFDRNLESHNQLEQLKGTVKFVNRSDAEERDRYAEASRSYIPLFKETDEWLVDFMRRHIVNADYCDVGIASRVDLSPSTYFRDVIQILNVPEGEFLLALENKLRKYTPFSGAAATNMMRFFYYSATQLKYGCHLSLHPARARMLEARSRVKTNPHLAKTILDAFDKEVRGAYYARKEKWLGKPDLGIRVPILTSYVLKKAEVYNDVLEAALEVRGSNAAKDFRAEIDKLSLAINASDEVAIDAILSRIDEAVDDWTRSLNFDPVKSTHKISLSVPIFGGLETEIDIPLRTRRLWKQPGDRILIFLHDMLSKSDFGFAGS